MQRPHGGEGCAGAGGARDGREVTPAGGSELRLGAAPFRSADEIDERRRFRRARALCGLLVERIERELYLRREVLPAGVHEGGRILPEVPLGISVINAENE